MTGTGRRTPDVLGAIGNTPLVELRRVVPNGAGRVVLKLEAANPTGSMKDRVARAMVTAAAKDGRLPAGGTVIDKAMIAMAQALSRQPAHWFCNQLENRDVEAGYHALGDEMWAQAGCVDAFVQSVGSAHSIRGTATALRRLRYISTDAYKT